MGKVDAVIRWFMPKEERFHELLLKDTQNLLRAVRLFAEVARSASLEERRVKSVQLKAIEHDGDQITRQIFEALNSTFITPLDREDIRSLASLLDDILDHLEGVGHYLVLFELKESTEAMRLFSDILVSMAEALDRGTSLVWDLANSKEIQAAIVRISELENQGDALYSTVTADLFKHRGNNPIEVLKWKEVYDGLEAACDECKNFTHTLGNVVIKNA
jgi:predicted phosphate transport protein (TIGR00153 family)